MINDSLLQFLADTDPMGLEYQMFYELKERAVRKIQAMDDCDLMEQYDYVSELAEDRKKRNREGGES